MKEKLQLAISFLTSHVNSASSSIEALLSADLKNVAAYADPVLRAEKLLEVLRKYGSPEGHSSVLNRLAALTVLKDMLAEVEADPTAEVSYEFYVGRADCDYAFGRDLSLPIVEAQLVGRTMEVLRALRLVECKIEWPDRTNGFKASFVVKAN
ncbi:hypothetical protein BH11CYA1_BH11CYA1_27490 [soil metagenome]